MTLLFTDLVASSELLEKLGDDAADRVRRTHFRLLRQSVTRHGGQEVKTLGDGLMAAFSSAVDGVTCAISMQQEIDRHNAREAELPLGVRVGLHAGEALKEDEDYFGRPVVIAKRLCDSAEAGQIVCSDLIESIVGTRGGFAFEDIGWLALKGIASPVPARRVIWEPAEEPTEESRREEIRRDDYARPRTRRVALLATVIAALVAVATLGILITRDEAPPAGTAGGPDEEAEPNEETEPGADPGTGPARVELDWHQVKPGGTGFGGTGLQAINRMVANDELMVAVGVDGLAGQSDAAVWTSTDGKAWRRADHGFFRQDGHQTMWGVTTGGPGFVSVGLDSVTGTVDAAVWTSTTGTDWKRVDPTQAALTGPGHQTMNRVTSWKKGLVAGGYQEAVDWDAAIWTSRTGRTWKKVIIEPGRAGDQEIRSVAAVGGRLVAVGWEDTGGLEGEDAVVWTSNDGLHWRRPTKQTMFGGSSTQRMVSVASGPRGFVAVGYDTRAGTGEDAIAWHSKDGLIWKRALFNEHVFGGPANQRMWGVHQLDDGWIAVGLDSGGGGPDAAVWIHDEGRWKRLPPDEETLGGDQIQEMRWVTTFKDLVVGGGWEGPESSYNAAAWWAAIGK